MPSSFLPFLLLAVAAGVAAAVRGWARRPEPLDAMARTWLVLAACFATTAAWLACAMPA